MLDELNYFINLRRGNFGQGQVAGGKVRPEPLKTRLT